MIPGEYILKDDPIVCNPNQESMTLQVTNTGDRPVQVGSNFHFFEVNKFLKFDREKAFGKRMDILAGTAKRFEPGETMEVQLIDLNGDKIAFGASNLTKGDTKNEEVKTKALKKMTTLKFKSE